MDFSVFLKGEVKVLMINMADNESQELKFPVFCHLVTREFNIRWFQLIFYPYTLFNCVKKIGQLYGYVGL